MLIIKIITIIIIIIIIITIALFLHKLKTTHISRYKTSNFEQSYTVILLNPSNMQLSSTIHPPCTWGIVIDVFTI